MALLRVVSHFRHFVMTELIKTTREPATYARIAGYVRRCHYCIGI